MSVEVGDRNVGALPTEILEDDIRKARILVVDDQQANLVLLEAILRRAGYGDVNCCRDPREVCAKHRAHRYDLIVLDLEMPEMSGFDVMDGLREVETSGYLPVLVVTAEPAHKLRALQAGAKDFVSKPFDVSEVLMRVRNLLEVRLLHVEIRRQNGELRKLVGQVVSERKISERLALSAPPDSIASPLPARPDVTKVSFPDASVLIAEIVGFGVLTTTLGPVQLRVIVEEIFGLFDVKTKEHALRKVKTLANSYMAAAGIGGAAGDCAARAACLALDMLEAMERFRERSGVSLGVRIGLATGPAVAGVIGRRMYLYDLWGSTVTMAGRMESHGLVGRVKVCGRTRVLLGNAFRFEASSGIEIEGSGEAETWFLSRHPEGSSDSSDPAARGITGRDRRSSLRQLREGLPE